MDTDHEKIRLTVADIYLRHGFLAYLIDSLTGVTAGTTDNMLLNVPVSKMDAERVLAFLSAKFSEKYNLDNVYVKLEGEKDEGGTL